ncbi:MAG: carbonic anhydrase [Aetokthonos hydrillicola CCALA 1050]|nr:carbonic anhydrase [Aetokthonos hydrillicola CCALA 1050]
MERRHFLKLGVTGVFGTIISTSDLLCSVEPAKAGGVGSAVTQSLTPDAALEKLLEGNQRFTQHHPQYPDQSAARLLEVAQAQHPFATILSCADSRVPPEIIFDQGIGDVFDIRIAGNIAIPEAIGSIEYAAVLLGTPVVMVLGHERCGAVTATVQKQALLGNIGTFVQAIKPALEKVSGQSGDAVENAVVANVQYQIERLGRSQLLTERVESGKLKIVGGRYDLDTGKVTIV